MRRSREAMLDGIVMNVIEKGLEFLFVVNRMLPESPLPHVCIPMFTTRWRNADFRPGGGVTPIPRRVGTAHGRVGPTWVVPAHGGLRVKWTFFLPIRRE